ncbi:hypothetical protein FRC11_008498 [Ceratobasidium sp. 423]|nr:hypothetical protein FRC11_008498 [Ceratobasidium sp. 423]
MYNIQQHKHRAGPSTSTTVHWQDNIRHFHPPSPTPTNSSETSCSGSSSSVKSIRFNDSKDAIGPGQYSPFIPKLPPKPVLKYRMLHAANAPSLFAGNTPMVIASKAMDDVLCDLRAWNTNVKSLAELESFINNIFIPAHIEKHKAFVDQLYKLEGLKTRLNGIPTQGIPELVDKHGAAGEAIERALERTRKYQHKFYSRLAGAANTTVDDIFLTLDNHVEQSECSSKLGIVAASATIDDILCELVTCVKNFKCPIELDFPTNTVNTWALLNTEKNKPFIDQLRKLDEFRTRLAEIPTYNDARLKEKHKNTGAAIGRALTRMKEHQLKLHNKFAETLEGPEAEAGKATAAIDDILRELVTCVKGFQCPSEPDFSADSEDAMILRNTEKNKPFINQLRKLNGLQTRLAEIPTHNDAQLVDKHKATGSPSSNEGASTPALREAISITGDNLF